MRGLLLYGLLVVVCVPLDLHGQNPYPLDIDGPCGATFSCRQVLNAWNDATWQAVVDDQIHPNGTLATVRWYTTEGECDGTKCESQLRPIGTRTLDVETHHFGGVTDEFGNVLLSHALGDDEPRFRKLRNFSELLRLSSINDLQCWKFYVDGQQSYSSASQLCVELDSASDASIRILGAYGVACAKQRGGVWPSAGVPDYCADYERQGNAIFGLSGPSAHGEVKRLANGEAFLPNGFNNYQDAPANHPQVFRPDYYELQFLMDFAEYENDDQLRSDVIDMLNDYIVSTGINRIHRGKTGQFNEETTIFTCKELCTPPYMDNIDTWRAVPALSGLLAAHAGRIPPATRKYLFDYWWQAYGGGNPAYPGAGAKPFEIYSDQQPAVKQPDDSYKVFAMWIPLGMHYDAAWVDAAVSQLVDVEYLWDQGHFGTAEYYGAYYSQFAQRAIGLATGAMDPATYVLSPPRLVTATATSPMSVTITWSPAAGATEYEVVRSGADELPHVVNRTSNLMFVDGTVMGSRTYVYKVRSINGGSTSAAGAADIATTLLFTDDPIQPAFTIVKAAHLSELRSAANAVRAAAGLPGFSFTDPAVSPGTVPIKATHVTELRAALAAAFDALGLGAVGFADSIISAGIPIKGTHFDQLRRSVE